MNTSEEEISPPEHHEPAKRWAAKTQPILSFAGLVGIVTAVVLWPSAFGGYASAPSLHFITHDVRKSIRFTTYEVGDCVDFGGKKMDCPYLYNPAQLRVTKILSITEPMDMAQATLYALDNCPYKVLRFNWPSPDTYAIGDRQFACIGASP